MGDKHDNLFQSSLDKIFEFIDDEKTMIAFTFVNKYLYSRYILANNSLLWKKLLLKRFESEDRYEGCSFKKTFFKKMLESLDKSTINDKSDDNDDDNNIEDEENENKDDDNVNINTLNRRNSFNDFLNFFRQNKSEDDNNMTNEDEENKESEKEEEEEGEEEEQLDNDDNSEIYDDIESDDDDDDYYYNEMIKKKEKMSEVTLEDYLRKRVILSRPLSKKSHIKALKTMELYNISVENYSEAGKCVEEIIVRTLAENEIEIDKDKIENIISKITNIRKILDGKELNKVNFERLFEFYEPELIHNIQDIRLPTLNGIHHFCQDKMWECGIQMEQLISDILNLNKTDPAIMRLMEESCTTEGRFFPEYFFVETFMNEEDKGKYIVKMKTSKKLQGCIELARTKWPGCYIYKSDGDQKPKDKLVVEIHPCSPSKLETSFAEAKDLPPGVWVSGDINGIHSKGDENTNVNVFLYSTPMKDYKDPSKKESSKEVKNKIESENICWISEYYIVPENPFPSISTWEKVKKVVNVMKKPIYSCCDILRAKINQLETILSSIDGSGALTKKGFNALQQYLMGVIVAGVNGGINVYLDAFLTEEYYAENPEDKAVLDNMCTLLEKEKDILKKGLKAYQQNGNQKFYDQVNAIYVALAANIDKAVTSYRSRHHKPELGSSPCPLVFPIQSMNSSLRMSVVKRKPDQIVRMTLEDGCYKSEQKKPAMAGGKEEQQEEYDEEDLINNVSDLSQSIKRNIQRPPEEMMFSNRAAKTRAIVPINFKIERNRGIQSSASKVPQSARRDQLFTKRLKNRAPQSCMKSANGNPLGRTMQNVNFNDGTPIKSSQSGGGGGEGGGTNADSENGNAAGAMLKSLAVRHPEVSRLAIKDQTPLRTHQRMKSNNTNIANLSIKYGSTIVVVTNNEKGCTLSSVAPRNPEVAAAAVDEQTKK